MEDSLGTRRPESEMVDVIGIVRGLVDHIGLALDIVDGVEKLPATVSYRPKFTSKCSSYSCTLIQDTNQKLIDAWKSKDVNARHYLFATIERQQQNTLYGCQSANDIWVRLTTQHAQNAAENKHLLMQQFFEYKYHPGSHYLYVR